MRDGPSRLVGTTMLLCQLAARSRGRGHYVQGTRRSSGEQSGMAAVSASHRPTRQRAAAHASIRARVPAQEFNPCSAAAEASAHARVWPRHGTVPVPSRGRCKRCGAGGGRAGKPQHLPDHTSCPPTDARVPSVPHCRCCVFFFFDSNSSRAAYGTRFWEHRGIKCLRH
jgi:hypothetical protein